jgi:hypothetical protein
VMTGLRDYEAWHHRYDDPQSDLSWRLRTVQGYIRRTLDERSGVIRVVSACAGDGRDLLEVLSERRDAARVSARLIEIHPAIARRAVEAAASTAARVDVRTVDAGCTDAYSDAVPADLVLLVGVFGNISEADLARTIGASPQLCSPGATLVWSRGRRHAGDLNDQIRAQFVGAGFTELAYATLDTGSWPAAGAMRYVGPPTRLIPSQRLFTFVR